MKRLFLFLALLAVVGFVVTGSTYAFAGQKDMTCQQRFQAYDIDHNGKVTMDEYKAGYDKGLYRGAVPNPSSQEPASVEFEKLDTQHMGYLTPQEFCAGQQE